MPQVELLKYQKYEDIFNNLSGSDLDKLKKIANTYKLYKYKTGVDSPFETALMQTMTDNADFLGKMIIKLVDSINSIPDETGHKGENLSTNGVKNDIKWSPTLTTPSKLFRDHSISNALDVNHLLLSPFDTNGFVLEIPNSVDVTIL